jgi:hypothetical protein
LTAGRDLRIWAQNPSIYFGTEFLKHSEKRSVNIEENKGFEILKRL